MLSKLPSASNKLLPSKFELFSSTLTMHVQFLLLELDEFFIQSLINATAPFWEPLKEWLGFQPKAPKALEASCLWMRSASGSKLPSLLF